MRKFTGRRLADYCEQRLPNAFGEVVRGTQRSDRVRQVWQQSRHPVGIWTHDFWHTKVDYLHDNPRRKGLVHSATDWRFSSASYWLSEMRVENDVILTGVEW